MLLQFITAEPSFRYTQVEAFMNLGPFREIENALKDWKDRLETEHQSASADVTAIAASLKTVFELAPDAPLDSTTVVGRLNGVLRDLRLKEVHRQEEREERQKQIAEELGGGTQNERLNALAALKGEVQQLGVPQEFAELLKGLVEALEELEREMNARTEAVLTDLLVRGKEAIEIAAAESCPLCEQPINREAVLERLDERIASDARITAARELVAARRRELLPRVQELTRAFKSFMERWGKHMGAQLPDPYTHTLPLLVEMEAVLGRDETKSAYFREFASRLKSTVQSHAEAMAGIDAVIAKEGGGDRRTLLSKAASMIDKLLADWPRYQAAAARAKRIAARGNTIERLHAHCD